MGVIAQDASDGAAPTKASAFEASASNMLRFYLNGNRIELDGNTVDPDSTLLDFIRSQGQGLTGTKLGCGEGGCGACTVVIQSKHPITKAVQHLAVNACLAPLISVDGKHIITVEGLGNADNPHPLQERLWKLSGSQCGFCTPGIVMSIYALLRTTLYRGQLTVSDVELEGVLDGNLCRCTGYKPILDAAKTFVGDYTRTLRAANGHSSEPNGNDDQLIVPVNYTASNMQEDEKLKNCRDNCCKKEVTNADVSTDVSLPVVSALETENPPIDPLAGGMGRTPAGPVEGAEGSAKEPPKDSNGVAKPVSSPTASKPKGCGRADCCQLSNGDGSSKTPARMTPLFPRFDMKPYQPNTELIYPPSLAKHVPGPLKFGGAGRVWMRPTTLEQLFEIKAAHPHAKFVGGSSEIGIEVHIIGRHYPVSVYVSDIPELFAVTPPSKESPVLTFGANLPLSELDALCQSLIESLPAELTDRLVAIRSQLRYFAGFQIRNTASVAGNIATASPISDLNPVWVAIGAKIIAASEERGEFDLPLDQFFVGYRKTTLPADSIIVRIVVPLNESADREVVRAYKQAKRRDDDIAIVTSCFAMRVSAEGVISHAHFAYGGMAAWTISTPETQKFLVGKTFSKQTLEDALDVLGKEIDLPFNVPGGMPSYRKTLALSFFFKFYTSVSAALSLPLGSSPLSSEEQDEIIHAIHRNPSSGQRDNSDPYASDVVGQQVPHLSGLKHVTGEAVYIDDMPKVGNEGYGALVLSKNAHAKLLSVDASAALEMPGALYWVSHLDLPNERANYWGAAAIDEVFFAVDEVVSHGQPIGMLVATSKILAQKAARAVKIEYEPLPAILTIEEAIAADSYFPQYDRRIVRGRDIDEAMAASPFTLSGSSRLGGQEHFYLETMAALCVPKEGGEMEVYSSTQALNDAQRWAAQVTGVPRNRIVARGKRMGGGFGGKETRQLTAVTALAAKKGRRPVRCMLDRGEDIQTTGQRHPTRGDWKIGFDEDGRITALQVDFWANGGYSLDISGGVVDRALAHLDNSYWIPSVSVRGRVCKTNTVSNTAYRGFGGPQGMAVSEHYIEAIAHKLGKNIDDIRALNLYKEGQETHYHQPVLDWHVPRLLEECRSKSQYDERRAAVEQFNKEHKWRKRGISLIPTKFGLAFGVKAMNQGTASVLIYLDGSVLVAHGGTEMGQGLYTKCCQIAAQELGVPLESVFTSESSTATVPNASPTAGSAGSDLNGYAVFNACAELRTRLEPYRQKLGPDATFAAVAGAAWADRVPLSAVGHFATPDLGYEWGNQKKTGNLFAYFTQGVACSEIEVDTLTGDHTVLRTDIHMDVGKSLNPAVDYGQIEGAFVQGQGWVTTEESLWFRHNGAIATTGPGAYKIPGFSDIPQVFNVSLLRDAEWPNIRSIHSSKGIGEPPFFLGVSVALALRHALSSARADAGVHELQEFRFPMTSERIRLACADELVKKGTVVPKSDAEKSFFVHI